MKDMKFRIQNEQHSKEIQECLFKLGFAWKAYKNRKVQYTEAAYLFAYWENKSITKSELGDGNYFKNHDSVETTLEELKQMLKPVEQKKPHVHADLIHAWADGAEVQYWEQGEWHDCNRPSWFPDIEYRIKPEETDVEKYGIEAGDVWYIPYFKKYHTLRSVDTNPAYLGGRVITTINDAKISYRMFIEDKSELVFRRGVVNLL